MDISCPTEVSTTPFTSPAVVTTVNTMMPNTVVIPFTASTTTPHIGTMILSNAVVTAVVMTTNTAGLMNKTTDTTSHLMTDLVTSHNTVIRSTVMLETIRNTNYISNTISTPTSLVPTAIITGMIGSSGDSDSSGLYTRLY